MKYNEILWEPWLDPFDTKSLEEDDNDDEENDLDEAWKISKKINTKKNSNIGPCLVGPMGIIPITEGNMPSKLYNFWIMHTNFAISHKIKDILEKVDGVETLDIFTKYRARIAFGKVFKSEEVKDRIESILCKKNSEEKTVTNLELLKNQLSSKYKFWAIEVQKNKKMKAYHGNSSTEVENAIQNTKEDSQYYKSWK